MRLIFFSKYSEFDVDFINAMKNSEFISKCRHINKRLLIKVKDDIND